MVTYYDSITTEAHVYLILEFVENGSLLSSLKQFAGRFPEKLVAVYTRQVLQGLAIGDKVVVYSEKPLSAGIRFKVVDTLVSKAKR